MSRAFLVVMDSVGIGGANDAPQFFNGIVPDTGANTIRHIAQACANGQTDKGRAGPLWVPNLVRLGLGRAAALSDGEVPPGLEGEATGAYGAASEISKGKDTPSGHWELAGLPVPWDWTYFPNETSAFPEALCAAVCALAGTSGILGNCHASGTEILDRCGAQHMQTGFPICYTSADSVFQVAAHEQSFGLDRLYKLCADLAPILHEMRVGRVIARPFVGTPKEGFARTQNRRDYAITPPKPLLTNWVQDAGRTVYAIGKIGDILAMQGIDHVSKGADGALADHMADRVENAIDGSLTFANFVEFDSLYGHRRDVAGYARHLEWFDVQLGKWLARLRVGDLLIVTADHGNDPTWIGTDHTRERVPVLCQGVGSRSLGEIGFADVAASVAAHLGIENQGAGQSFL